MTWFELASYGKGSRKKDNNKGMKQRPVTTSKRLVRNTILNVTTLVSHAVIGFFLIRFFLGRLGEVRYGVWLLIGIKKFTSIKLLLFFL